MTTDTDKITALKRKVREKTLRLKETLTANPTTDIDEVLETLLARAIQEEMDGAILESVRTGKPHNMTPMTFENPADKEKFKENFQRVVDRDISGFAKE